MKLATSVYPSITMHILPISFNFVTVATPTRGLGILSLVNAHRAEQKRVLMATAKSRFSEVTSPILEDNLLPAVFDPATALVLYRPLPVPALTVEIAKEAGRSGWRVSAALNFPYYRPMNIYSKYVFEATLFNTIFLLSHRVNVTVYVLFPSHLLTGHIRSISPSFYTPFSWFASSAEYVSTRLLTTFSFHRSSLTVPSNKLEEFLSSHIHPSYHAQPIDVLTGILEGCFCTALRIRRPTALKTTWAATPRDKKRVVFNTDKNRIHLVPASEPESRRGWIPPPQHPVRCLGGAGVHTKKHRLQVEETPWLENLTAILIALGVMIVVMWFLIARFEASPPGHELGISNENISDGLANEHTVQLAAIAATAVAVQF
jgi:hypothetical protein